MAGILVSPSLDFRVRKRNALYKQRNESPKFRDILRERCHARIKAKRCALIDKFRNLNEHEVKTTFSEILQEEISTLKNNQFSPRQFNEEEEDLECSEENQWLIDEYEKFLDEATYCLDLENQVICPICEKSVLQFDESSPVCQNCDIRLPPVESPSALINSLDAELRKHSAVCNADAKFSLVDISEIYGLFLICDTCGCCSQALM